MEEVLRAQTVGHLGVWDGEEVYVIPVNYTYDRGRVLFHCALEGRKLDVIRAHPDVCFEVSQMEGAAVEHAGELCDAAFVSVICWGKARVIDDAEERREVLQAFQVRYATAEKPRTSISVERVKGCGAVVIEVERMTGRERNGEGQRRWEWRKGEG
jgi:hypothetical protein